MILSPAFGEPRAGSIPSVTVQWRQRGTGGAYGMTWQDTSNKIFTIGNLISFVSIILALYFWYDGRTFPELTYGVHPVKAVLVKAGQTSKLTTYFENKPITSDITTTQVYVWNRGKAAIKRDHILQPIVLRSEKNIPILEATIRKRTREVTKFQLGTGELAKGRISISWSILEQNDGGIIQLTYAGGPDVNFDLEGVIEGQKIISAQRLVEQSEPKSSGYIFISKTNAFLFYAVTFLAISLIAAGLIFYERSKRQEVTDAIILRQRPGLLSSRFILIAVAVVMSVYSFWRYIEAKISSPPFGF